MDELPVPSLLADLLRPGAPSGYEAPATAVWREAAAFAEVSADGIGSSIARVGAASPLLAVVGHIDEIGLVITHIDEEGFLWFAPIGAWDPQTLIGQRVQIQGRDGLVPGLVAPRPMHMVVATDKLKEGVALEELCIDVGASDRAAAEARIRIGDPVVIAAEPVRMIADRLVSRAFDNRIGAYVALESLRRVAEGRGPGSGSLAAVASVQEEVGLLGARTVAHRLRPDIAIAVDGYYAGAPGVDERRIGSHPLGSGPIIGRGVTLSPKLSELLIETAEAEGIAYTLSGYGSSLRALGLSTHTDADALQISRSGIPTGVVSVPLRYVHSPVEMIDLGDLEAAVELIVAFASRLSPDLDLTR